MSVKKVVVSWICLRGMSLIGLAVRRVNLGMSLIFGKSCERLGAPAEAIMSAVEALPRLSRVLKEILQAPAGWEQAGVSLASHSSGFTCFRSEVLVPGGAVADCAEPSAEQEN